MKIKSIGLVILLFMGSRLNAQCVLSSNTWQSQPIPTQTGTFTYSVDATPLGSTVDQVIGLSPGIAATWSDIAVGVRFNSSGYIDVRNGSDYGPNTIPYTANKSIHFRIVVNIPVHTYSVYVTVPGQPEVQIASNYAFRSEQSVVSHLADFSYTYSSASSAPTGICNFALGMTLSQAVQLANTAWGVDSAVSVQFNAVQNWVPWYCTGQTDLAPLNNITLFGILPDPYAGTPNSFWRGCGLSWEAAFRAAGITLP